MVSVERTFVVNKPVDQVVGYLRDFGHAEAWDPGTKTCTQTSTGPVEVGTTWHNVSEFAGREVELTYTLSRAESHRLTFTGENKSATSTDDMTFAAADGGTQVTYNADIEFHGLAKLADPFMKPAFSRLGDETEKQMTDVIDAL